MRELALAVRRLRRQPGLTAIALVTRALGLGAGTTILEVINAALFRPLPVERPDELVFLNRDGRGAIPTHVDPASPAAFAEAGIVLAILTGIACVVPVRRALKADPAVILRSE